MKMVAWTVRLPRHFAPYHLKAFVPHWGKKAQLSISTLRRRKRDICLSLHHEDSAQTCHPLLLVDLPYLTTCYPSSHLLLLLLCLPFPSHCSDLANQSRGEKGEEECRVRRATHATDKEQSTLLTLPFSTHPQTLYVKYNTCLSPHLTQLPTRIVQYLPRQPPVYVQSL